MNKLFIIRFVFHLSTGNKKDVRNDLKLVNTLRIQYQDLIKTEEGEAMAKKIGAHAFFECSSKTRENVKQLFEASAKAALYDTSLKKKEHRLSTLNKKIKRCLIM